MPSTASEEVTLKSSSGFSWLSLGVLKNELYRSANISAILMGHVTRLPTVSRSGPMDNLRSVGAFASCLLLCIAFALRSYRRVGFCWLSYYSVFLRGTCFWDMEQQISMKLWSIWLRFSCEKAESQSEPCRSLSRLSQSTSSLMKFRVSNTEPGPSEVWGWQLELCLVVLV